MTYIGQPRHDNYCLTHYLTSHHNAYQAFPMLTCRCMQGNAWERKTKLNAYSFFYLLLLGDVYDSVMVATMIFVNMSCIINLNRMNVIVMTKYMEF